MKLIYQKSTYDCGIACIATLLTYKKNNKNKRNKLSGIEIRWPGLSVNDIETIANDYELPLKCYKINQQTSVLKLKDYTPFIAIIKVEEQNHYIIINKIENDFITIWDPNPQQGVYTLLLSNFCTKWTGHFFIIKK